MRRLLIIGFLVLIVAGCSTKVGPNPENMMQQNTAEDIFMFEKVIYRNAEDIDWVKSSDFTKDKLVGEIRFHYERGSKFKSEMASKLPIGAKIYSIKEKKGLVLIIDVDGKELEYLGLVEG